VYATARCACEGEFTGADCSQRSETLALVSRDPPRWDLPATLVPADGWLYVSVNLVDLLPVALVNSWTAAAAPTASAGTEAVGAAVATDAAKITSSLSAALGSYNGLDVLMVRQSALGDPDLFVRLAGRWPSLREHDLANTDCDSCAPNGASSSTNTPGRPRAVRLTTARLMAAVETNLVQALSAAAAAANSTASNNTTTADDASSVPTDRASMLFTALKVRIGLHGYCCDSSMASLSVSGAVRPSSPSPWLWLGPLLGLLLLVALLLGARWALRRRDARRLQQGRVMMPLPSSDAPQMMLTTTPATPSSATHMQQGGQMMMQQQQQVQMQRPVTSAVAAPRGGRGASPLARARFVDVELAERPRGSVAVPSAADAVSTPSSPAEAISSNNIAAPPSSSQRGHAAAESGRLTGARSSSNNDARGGRGGSRRFMPLASHDDADADADALELELQDNADGTAGGGELHGIDLGDLELGEGGQDDNDDEDALVL
jgi:hypothetical protein